MIRVYITKTNPFFKFRNWIGLKSNKNEITTHKIKSKGKRLKVFEYQHGKTILLQNIRFNYVRFLSK